MSPVIKEWTVLADNDDVGAAGNVADGNGADNNDIRTALTASTTMTTTGTLTATTTSTTSLPLAACPPRAWMITLDDPEIGVGDVATSTVHSTTKGGSLGPLQSQLLKGTLSTMSFAVPATVMQRQQTSQTVLPASQSQSQTVLPPTQSHTLLPPPPMNKPTRNRKVPPLPLHLMPHPFSSSSSLMKRWTHGDVPNVNRNNGRVPTSNSSVLYTPDLTPSTGGVPPSYLAAVQSLASSSTATTPMYLPTPDGYYPMMQQLQITSASSDVCDAEHSRTVQHATDNDSRATIQHVTDNDNRATHTDNRATGNSTTHTEDHATTSHTQQDLTHMLLLNSNIYNIDEEKMIYNDSTTHLDRLLDQLTPNRLDHHAPTTHEIDRMLAELSPREVDALLHVAYTSANAERTVTPSEVSSGVSSGGLTACIGGLSMGKRTTVDMQMMMCMPPVPPYLHSFGFTRYRLEFPWAGPDDAMARAYYEAHRQRPFHLGKPPQPRSTRKRVRTHVDAQPVLSTTTTLSSRFPRYTRGDLVIPPYKRQRHSR